MGSAVFDFIVPFIIILGILVFFHELGHYLAAKIFGMKVDAFSLGFPPRAWGFRWGTKKLRAKFMREVHQAITNNPAFRDIHALLVQHQETTDKNRTLEILIQSFSIEVREIKTHIPGKKGKMKEQVSFETHVTIRDNVAAPSSALVQPIYEKLSADNDLTDLLYQRSLIYDDEAYKAHYQTDYCLSWIPLGGYCKINGMIDESLDPESMKEGPAKPWEFRAKPVWQKILVISGGVLFNFFLAVVIFFLFTLKNGLPDMEQYNNYSTEVASVLPDSPAHQAGLKAGDRVISVAGKPVSKWVEMVAVIHQYPEKEITVEWIRDGKNYKANLTPRRSTIQTADGNKEVGLIGIAAPPIPEFTRPAAVHEALAYGFTNTVYLTGYILKSVKQIIFGEQSFKDAMGGPIAIIRMTGEVKQRQGWEGLWYFMALLSVSLAVFNLFPIPALDGGHLVFLFIEAIIRRPVSVKVKLYAQQAGMAILLLFILYVIFNDITKWTGTL